MKLNEFVSKLYSSQGNYGNVVSVASHYNHKIVENDKGEYFVDGIQLEVRLESLEEVRDYIDLQETASKTKIRLYEDISETKIASIIKKYNEDTKITTKLIENYMTLASSKVFTIDPVLLEMRNSYKTANIFDTKLDFKLNDGKQVAIGEQTMQKISELLNNCNDKQEIIDYMTESRDNFVSVVRQLQG
jgi:hypothetical protein